MRSHCRCPVGFVVYSQNRFLTTMLGIPAAAGTYLSVNSKQKPNWIFYNGVALDPKPKPNVLCGESDELSPVPVDGGKIKNKPRSIRCILGFLRLLPHLRRGDTGASAPTVIKGHAI